MVGSLISRLHFRARWKSSLGTRLEWRGREVGVCDDGGKGRWGCVMMVGREGGDV